jgi:hypothetical protein
MDDETLAHLARWCENADRDSFALFSDMLDFIRAHMDGPEGRSWPEIRALMERAK